MRHSARHHAVVALCFRLLLRLMMFSYGAIMSLSAGFPAPFLPSAPRLPLSHELALSRYALLSSRLSGCFRHAYRSRCFLPALRI